MNNSDSKKFCLDLLRCDNENEVSDLLRSKGYLNNDECWKPLGNIIENFSIVGNQQNAAVAALAEKIVNSIDAVLIDECKKTSVDPRAEVAPSSMIEAIERFFHIEEGLYENIGTEKRREIAGRISLVATGSKDYPCYTIVDSGEGQTPEDMPKTLLSLPGSGPGYKSKIRFVQGIFNMGGTGVLPFCGIPPGAKNYELIISRKDPNIATGGLSTEWGFSIVRRRRPSERHSSSTYEYLIPEGKILSFKSDTLTLLPGTYPAAYDRSLEWGTCIKLYNYQIGDLKTNALLDLLYELNRYFFRIGLPIRVYETRDYQSNYYETTLVGMSVRLADNKKTIMEENFPSSGTLNIPRIGTIPTTIFALKKKAREGHWLGNKSIQFILNGQVHAFFPPSFLKSKEVGLYYSGQDVLVVLDCTDISDDVREDIFMPSRDRLRTESPYAKAILTELQKHLQKHEGLQLLEQLRRNEQLQEQFSDNKPLKEILGKLIKKAPSLAFLFNKGEAIERPENFNYNVDEQKSYEGKYYPTFFRLREHYRAQIIECPIDKGCMVTFETDANNDYFSRANNRGKLMVDIPEMFGNLTLWNGISRLRIKAPKRAKVGERYLLNIEVNDKHQTKPFTEKVEFQIVAPALDVSDAPSGKKTDKGRKKNTTQNGKPTPQLKLPNIIEVTKGSKQWEEFGFNALTGIVIVPSTAEKDYDVFVNMDNEYYQYERRNANGADLQVLHSQYKYGLVLASLAMVHNLKNDKNIRENEVYEIVKKSSEGLAMTILPIIKSLGGMRHAD